MNRDQILLVPIKDLAKNTFEIGSYQRGYKWGKKEVLELLNDIDSFDSNQGLYCLQPIILKPLSGDKKSVSESNHQIFTYNEVIDGQQRNTTIFLLLNYLIYKGYIGESNLFHIDFKTREKSGVFLTDKLSSIYQLSLEAITYQELRNNNYENLTTINSLWKSYIQAHQEFNNVDVYHFFTVTCYLIRWIEDRFTERDELELFIQKLLNHVKVIWYSLNSDQNREEIIKIFLNNNKGKIRLTSSELIKALFILDIQKSESSSVASLQINQFATAWDMIEKQLQNDSFWYFLQPDDTKYLQGTRIDFLFDLYFLKNKNMDAYYSYREIENIFNNPLQSTAEIWEEVIQLYYKLLNWFEDQYLYHYIGYITNAKIKDLFGVLSVSKKKNNVEFKKELHGIIKAEFHRTEKNKNSDENTYVYTLENLHYKNSYIATLNVLLLYNVLYYIDNMAEYKFPFELFVKQKWSIEHITPQSSKDFKEGMSFLQWAKDLIAYVGEESYTELNQKIREVTSDEELRKDESLVEEIKQLALHFEELTHSIQNLLLLDKNTNSSLSNSLFSVKRNRILEFDRNGINDNGDKIFIPIETLNAFNKTFSSEMNIENWTQKDGNQYLNAIENRLINFLPKKI